VFYVFIEEVFALLVCVWIFRTPGRILSTQEPVLYINVLMNIHTHGLLTEQGRNIRPEGMKFCISIHVYMQYW
jgi:hypothetical protein